MGSEYTGETPADQTAPGVRYLKEVWGIASSKKREEAPKNVNSDIYAVPEGNKRIPRRRHKD